MFLEVKPAGIERGGVRHMRSLRQVTRLAGRRGGIAPAAGAVVVESLVLLGVVFLIALFVQQLGHEINYKLGSVAFQIGELGGGTETSSGGGTIICESRIDEHLRCFRRCYAEGNYHSSVETRIECPTSGSFEEGR